MTDFSKKTTDELLDEILEDNNIFGRKRKLLADEVKSRFKELEDKYQIATGIIK